MHRPRLLPALLTLGAAFATSGCSLVTEQRIADGANTPRSYHTVAGAVHVGHDSTIRTAKTVAGNIHIDAGAATRSLGSVAGEIRIGPSVRVAGDVSTIAGGIRIDDGTHVTGKVTSTAGAIALNGCRVDGPVRITKGALRTRGPTRLPRGVLVRHTAFAGDDHTTRIDIGPGADVASIQIEAGAKVEVRISREARVGSVTGATASYY